MRREEENEPRKREKRGIECGMKNAWMKRREEGPVWRRSALMEWEKLMQPRQHLTERKE